MPTQNPHTHEPDPRDRCYEEIDQLEAHLLAAEAPEAWVLGDFDEESIRAAIAESPYSVDVQFARELLTPLDPGARGRLVDRALGSYVPAGRIEPVVARSAAPPPRGWLQWLPIPISAVAAAAMTLLYVDLRSPQELPRIDRNPQEVSRIDRSPQEVPRIDASASPAMLSGDAHDTGTALQVRQNEWVYIHCHTSGSEALEIAAVHAQRAAPGSGAAELLRASPVKSSAEGKRLHVHVDLPAGPWQVSCLGTVGGRPALGSPAMINVL